MARRPKIGPAAFARGGAVLCILMTLWGTASISAQAGNPVQTEQAAHAQNDPGKDENISGLSVIVEVDSTGGALIYHADGYRIRISTPGTITAFKGSLKTATDVRPGTWIHFEGVLDGAGVLMARKADFYPPGTRRAFTAMGPKKPSHAPNYHPVTKDGLLDANGNFVSAHTKVRYSGSGGVCGWHRVPADALLQERVLRIGMSVVPEYQKQLPIDAPSRISFRFYAVADDKVRSAFVCNDGLVLVPKNVVERLKKDDQLAALLSEAVAFHLQRQLSTVTPLDMATDVAVVALAFLTPEVYIAGDLVVGIIGYEHEIRVHRECGRMALQLMADAGYDPWQAPEAWRILAPKDPPPDIQSVDYPGEGRFQLDILKSQYKEIGSGGKIASLPTERTGTD